MTTNQRNRAERRCCGRRLHLARCVLVVAVVLPVGQRVDVLGCVLAGRCWPVVVARLRFLPVYRSVCGLSRPALAVVCTGHRAPDPDPYPDGIGRAVGVAR